MSRLTSVVRQAQWEYKTLSLHPRDMIILEDGVPSVQITPGVSPIVAFHTMAQDLGDDGWELVSTDGFKYWVFKRSVSSRRTPHDEPEN